MSLNLAVTSGASRVIVCCCGCSTRRRRYPSDLTDAEWTVIAPLLPPPLSQAGRGGRPEKHHRRTVIDAIRYVCDNGVKWRALPADFPPWPTVYSFFAIWTQALIWPLITDRLRGLARTTAGKNRRPSAGAIDSQSVAKSADAVVPRQTSGFDPYKKINGRKRHIVVDTMGWLICALVTAANVQDRDAAKPLLAGTARRGIRHVWADSGYHGDLAEWARHYLNMTVEIVHRPKLGRGRGFHVLARRWVVERTFAWISRRRRCARDYERLPATHTAWIHIAAHITMTRYITRHNRSTN